MNGSNFRPNLFRVELGLTLLNCPAVSSRITVSYHFFHVSRRAYHRDSSLFIQLLNIVIKSILPHTPCPRDPSSTSAPHLLNPAESAESASFPLLPIYPQHLQSAFDLFSIRLDPLREVIYCRKAALVGVDWRM